MSATKRLLERIEKPVAVLGQALTAIAAIAALIISIYSLNVAMEPAERQRASRNEAVAAMIQGIVDGTTEEIARARSYVAADSLADEFLWFLTEVRRLSPPQGPENEMKSLKGDSLRFELCLPGYRVLWSDCLPFSDFTFDELDQITGWSIDGIPLRASFTFVGDSELALDDETSHLASGLLAYAYHPRSDMVTSLFLLDRTSLESTDVARIVVEDVRFENADEIESVGVQVGQGTIDAFDEATWAVTVPAGGFVGFGYRGVDRDGNVVSPDNYFWLFAP